MTLDDKILCTTKDPLREVRFEYDYSDLRPGVVRGRMADEIWTSTGYYLKRFTLIP